MKDRRGTNSIYLCAQIQFPLSMLPVAMQTGSSCQHFACQ
jgi:hypothetical protein